MCFVQCRSSCGVGDQLLDSAEPASVVALCEVGHGVHTLDGVTELIRVETSVPEHQGGNREHALLPVGVEAAVVAIFEARAEALLPPEVVDAVHLF